MTNEKTSDATHIVQLMEEESRWDRYHDERNEDYSQRRDYEKIEGFEEYGEEGEESSSLLPMNTLQQRQIQAVGKGIRQILRIVNILAVVLIVLFCIAVLNLYTESATWSNPLRCDKLTEEFVQRTQPIQGRHGESLNPHNPLSTSTLSPPPPSKAKRIPRPLTLYNETLVDNYRWMHEIESDPDVTAYIKSESDYTSAWIKESGVESLKVQLDREMANILGAMESQFFSGEGEELGEEEESRHNLLARKPKKIERLEGTQFWDLDRWRYWLDETDSDFGILKRRPIPRGVIDDGITKRRVSYMQQNGFKYPSQSPDSLNRDPAKSGMTGGKTIKIVGGCTKETPTDTNIQLILDINRIAKKQKKKRPTGEFSFGTLEVQPFLTYLDHGNEVNSMLEEINDYSKFAKSSPVYAAYTFDTSGNERYHIRIITMPEDEDLKERQDDEDEEMAVQIGGSVVKDAGPDTRFIKIGTSLYLYFTRLDKKGLSREVWRVKVDSLEDEGLVPNNEVETEKGKKMRRDSLYEPEMVLREDDERNVLTVTESNDQRFLLITSAGQTTSYTYFFSIDYPERGWNIVRQPEEGVRYNVEHHTGYFYLHTNHGKSENFKVIRIPVEYSIRITDLPIISNLTAQYQRSSDLEKEEKINADEDIVIEHSSQEFLERFETFVEHFVAWVWRDGVQEIRIFLAPRASDTSPKFPLDELERIRPYNKDTKVATLMPGNIRHSEQRLFRDFFSTSLIYSNCSFIHPWAIYEFDMHSVSDVAPIPSSVFGFGGDADDGDDERQRNATQLVCEDSFPVGVKYGRSVQNQDHVKVSLKEPEVPSALFKETKKEQEKKEMAKFKELRIMVPSKHGSKHRGREDEKETLIPISIVYYASSDGKQFPRRTAFVQAYGAYGTMTSPLYTPEVLLPLLYRGLLYVQIHPRGDGVMGPEWYLDGKAENKLNTFYDVEDVLLYLRDSGMVEKGGCVIEGRSAGGLISGWIANRWGEPNSPYKNETFGGGSDQSWHGSENIVREMVKVVLTQVPFVDVIAGMADPDIPWVEYEWAEWGSPLESQEIFEVMKAYSPYDRIRNQPYPAMMIMGGLTDSRVSYAEPLKFVAKLRGVDGKTNDCQRIKSQYELQMYNERLTKEDGKSKTKMCAGKNETPLLLQMEEGGHFSGEKSLWMAFGLYNLDVEK
ncbi:hypothetical protein BGZ76_001814 [Entomortierella beljakovae]|nr:hypothetical protein BGZ76_001814 [Entomortierella beljakovae]